MASEVPGELYDAFREIKGKNYSAAETLLVKMLELGPADPPRQALIHSTLGILYKVRGEFQSAWRHYEQAERLLPDDPSLKIIVGNFLITHFAQYDAALKRMKRVLKLAKGVPSLEHQAYAMGAIAHLKKGERRKATELLRQAMANDFQSLVTSENINLEVIEAFLARNFERELCRTYLEKGLELARSRGEEKRIQLFSRLLEGIA